MKKTEQIYTMKLLMEIMFYKRRMKVFKAYLNKRPVICEMNHHIQDGRLLPAEAPKLILYNYLDGHQY